MNSQLALFLCLVFCGLVYRRESKRTIEVSPYLWLPTLWMMRVASRSLSYWFNANWSSGEKVETWYETTFLIVLILLAFWTLVRRTERVGTILTSNAWLFVLICYMALSVLWSEVMFSSVKGLVRTLGDLAMAIIVVTEARPLLAIWTMFRRCFILLIPLSIVFAKYFPELGRHESKGGFPDTWIGVATHKNELGMLCFLACFYFFVNLLLTKRAKGWHSVQLLRRMPVDVLYLVLSIYLLTGGGAAANSISWTSLMVTIGAIVLFLVMDTLKLRPMRVSVFIVVLILGLGIVQAGTQIFLNRSVAVVVADLAGKDPTLTGRTDLWTDLFELSKSQAILGPGYGGFWSPARMEYLAARHPWSPAQSHNGYLETFLQLGVVGLVLLLLVIFSAVRGTALLCPHDFEYGRFRLVLLLSSLAQNWSEAGFTRPTHFLWFLFLVVALNTKLPTNNELKTEQAKYPYITFRRNVDLPSLSGT